ncbi:hypothetical protein OAN04_05740 [Candidatus Pelagibacter ubique]|nr:hypothetical protein [Candidatus Pelagibacter ubique]
MKKNNKDSDIVKWSQIKSWINHFINNIPVFTFKGIILFLGVGLTLNVISFLFSIPVDGMYELIDQGGLIENLILVTIAGAIANYTFWGD